MSVPRQAQFAGASGEYYVAAVLAYKRLHVGMVPQGGQSIDMLVSTADGSRSTTVQVKSRGKAHKKRKGDGVIVGYDWFIGKRSSTKTRPCSTPWWTSRSGRNVRPSCSRCAPGNS
jgi:hypothetical protein